MKRIMIVLSTCITIALNACPIVLENDTDTWVSVTDLQGNHPTEFITKATTVKANKNPEIHADFRVQIGATSKKMAQSYRIQQISCSKDPVIHISAQDIQNKKLDPALFTIKEERIVTKRLQGE